MKKWGGYLFFFGAGSMVLSLMNLEFIILAWIDHWGESTGWSIRIGLAVIGGAMWILGKTPETESST